MNSGIAYALAFAVAVIVIAILVTRLVRREPHKDANASRNDGDAAATWIGIRGARDSADDDGPPY